MSFSEFFLRIIGVGEARIGMIWFMLAIILGFIANIVVLIGCASPNTQSVYLFRVGSAELVNATANVTGISPNKLQTFELPEYWYWGLSGVCMNFKTRSLFDVEVEEKITCQQTFPPVLTVEDMISFAVEEYLGDNKNPSTKAKMMEPWTDALAKIQNDLVEPSRPRDLMKGAAALCVLSTILSPIILILTGLYFTILRDHLRRWMLYALALLDALLFSGSAAMIGYAMREGPRGTIDLAAIPQEHYYGPGNVAFTLGALVKFIAIELFLFLLFLGLFLVLWLIYVCLLCCVDDRDRVKVKVKVVNSYFPM
ncbi:s-adenosylmethionine-dependent methyltransferase [Fusarium sporotrichioides]|uniref:S-adenosylmethionine-dependent methyltransferase n=1 Tax=Fusarium sporotrichioides TaxID=5514 RepID=A0A395SNL9_FUSSP|nr:s-adenosylmethionine-dependent methyltransferase [Fusarium sporotrichioides]